MMASPHLRLHPETLAAIAAHVLGDDHLRRIAAGYVLCRSSRISRDHGRGFVGRFVYRHFGDRRSIVETVPGLQVVSDATPAELRAGWLRLEVVVLPPVTSIDWDSVPPGLLATLVANVEAALAADPDGPG